MGSDWRVWSPLPDPACSSSRTIFCHLCGLSPKHSLPALTTSHSPASLRSHQVTSPTIASFATSYLPPRMLPPSLRTMDPRIATLPVTHYFFSSSPATNYLSLPATKILLQHGGKPKHIYFLRNNLVLGGKWVWVNSGIWVYQDRLVWQHFRVCNEASLPYDSCSAFHSLLYLVVAATRCREDVWAVHSIASLSLISNCWMTNVVKVDEINVFVLVNVGQSALNIC